MNYDTREVNRNGDIFYYLDSEIHRTGGPAVEFADGSRSWYQHGKLHRIGGPAILRLNGTEMWYWYGRLHREDGPAYVNLNNGRQYWYYHGKTTPCSSQEEFESYLKLKAFW